MEDFSRNFIGLSLTSSAFENEVEKLSDELNEESDSSISLEVLHGSFAQLEENGFDTKQIPYGEVYPGEEVLIIKQIDSPNPILYMRARTVKSDVGETTYLLKRYPGFSLNTVQDPQKFTCDLFYYLGITLERFKWQDKIFHPKAFAQMTPPFRLRKDNLGIKIRDSFKERHFQNFSLHDDVLEYFKTTTKLVRDLIFIRASQDKKITSNDPNDDRNKDEIILERILKPSENLSSEPLTNPNQILDIMLRLTILSLDVIILENRRANSYKSDDILTQKIQTCCAELESLNEQLDKKYDPTESAERHQLSDKAELSDFVDTYKEIAGDLIKISGLCKFRNPDMRVRAANMQVIDNRLGKLAKCIHDITRTGEATKKLMRGNYATSGAKDFFVNATRVVAVSEKDVEISLKFLEDFEASADDLKKFIDRSTSFGTNSPQVTKLLTDIVEYIPDLVLSKRKNSSHTKKVVDEIELQSKPSLAASNSR